MGYLLQQSPTRQCRCGRAGGRLTLTQ